MLKAIIFDMDGVLLKSEGAMSQSFNMVLEKYGAQLDVKNRKKYTGRSLKRINILPKNCVVIEDAVNGIQAANSANMKSVALITKNHPKEDFAEADYIFSDFKNLKLKDLTSLF